MVRRLVEQQQVGLAGQHARERAARQLAAREGRQLAVHLLVAEAEPVQHRLRAVAPAVAAVRVERGLGARVGVQRLLVVGAVRHRLLEPRQLGLDGEDLLRA